jgi:hypothetical protein
MIQFSKYHSTIFYKHLTKRSGAKLIGSKVQSWFVQQLPHFQLSTFNFQFIAGIKVELQFLFWVQNPYFR